MKNNIFYLILALSILTYPIPSFRLFGLALYFYLIILMLFILFFKLNYSKVHNKEIKLLLSSIFIIFSIILIYLINLNLKFETFSSVIAYLSIIILLDFIIDSHIDLKKLEYVIVISGAILLIYGYYGYLTGNVGNQAQLFWWDEGKYFGIHYLDSTRNTDSHYYIIPLLIVIYGKKPTKRPLIFLKSIYIFLSVLAVILSLSRGAWIASLLTVLFMIIINKNLKPKHFFSIILFSILSYFVLSYVGILDGVFVKLNSIFNSSISSSNNIRLELIKIAIKHIFTEFPTGLGNIGQIYTGFNQTFNHAENLYLNTLVEIGVIAFISYLFIWFFPFIKSMQNKIYRDPIILSVSMYLLVIYLFNTENLNLYLATIHGYLWVRYGTTIEHQYKEKKEKITKL